MARNYKGEVISSGMMIKFHENTSIDLKAIGRTDTWT
jgi:hypothetical protein